MRGSASTAAEMITGEALRRHAAALADDTFEGRATGTRGGRAAAGYLQTQFKAYGLKPAGDQGGYFQTFDGNSRNILGMIEGSDETLRGEVILVGALRPCRLRKLRQQLWADRSYSQRRGRQRQRRRNIV